MINTLGLCFTCVLCIASCFAGRKKKRAVKKKMTPGEIFLKRTGMVDLE
jgi:heterodisulfide reductase subunit C